MLLTRRHFTRIAAALPLLHAMPRAFAQASRIDSPLHGVELGLQPFCYHDLPNTPQNRPILIDRMRQNGLGTVELHAQWIEPRFTGPGIDPAEARNKLRAWRLANAVNAYRSAKADFDAAGIRVFSLWLNIDPTYTDAEIDTILEATKALGCKGLVGSYGLAVAARLVPFPQRHGLFIGLHNHDNLSDPDAFSNEESFVKGLALSPHFMATLDVRHFTAANGDCVAFLEKHWARTSSVHLGDRRRDNGRSTPFGEGDAPLIEILRMIRDNHWPIAALLEFEHGTTRNGVEEVAIAVDYCKKALA